ncbi:MAG: hypothetical protein ACRCY3_01735 [Sphingorhabdus sp.]
MPKRSPPLQNPPSEISNFQPVPLRTHEGWTPVRQKAFIEALAQTASVKQAAQAVNMSTVSCYHLRNHPQGAGFRQAWQAAIDFSVSRLKDIAFERAVEGRLEPVWQGGKLVGHKRVHSDAMLMFLLRQYGVDDRGRNVTVNYVRTRSAVAAGQGAEGASTQAEAEATTMTVRSARPSASDCTIQDHAAERIENFAGVALDATAQAEIEATLAACAARQREIGGSFDDPETTSFTAGKDTPLWVGSFEPPHGWVEEVEPFDPSEPTWQTIGDDRYLEGPDDSDSEMATPNSDF